MNHFAVYLPAIFICNICNGYGTVPINLVEMNSDNLSLFYFRYGFHAKSLCHVSDAHPDAHPPRPYHDPFGPCTHPDVRTTASDAQLYQFT